MSVRKFSFAVVILAAGASSRMGRPKMLLPWGETTVIGHLVGQWHRIGARQIAAVCAKGDHALNQELDRIGLGHEHRIVNPEPARGMFSSIQCAAGWNGWNAELSHWAFALGDQPHLNHETLLATATFASRNPDNICQPARNCRPRHPIFLPREIFSMLARTNDKTMKEFLQSHSARVQLLTINDAGLDLDLDTPADYERAVRS